MAAINSVRSLSESTGRKGPLIALTERSVFTATIKMSPQFFAPLKICTWPRCRRSKQPLVRTTFLPLFLAVAQIATNSAALFSFSGTFDG